MFINNAIRPIRRLLTQLNLSKYLETSTKDRKINSSAIKSPPIHDPKINSEIKPTKLIINTDKSNVVLEKSNAFLIVTRL